MRSCSLLSQGVDMVADFVWLSEGGNHHQTCCFFEVDFSGLDERYKFRGAESWKCSSRVNGFREVAGGFTFTDSLPKYSGSKARWISRRASMLRTNEMPAGIYRSTMTRSKRLRY
jgi:hypothetical protein